LDLYLIHWPVAFKYVEIDPTSRGWKDESIDDSDDGRNIDLKVSVRETWKGMEALVDNGKYSLGSYKHGCLKTTHQHKL